MERVVETTVLEPPHLILPTLPTSACEGIAGGNQRVDRLHSLGWKLLLVITLVSWFEVLDGAGLEGLGGRVESACIGFPCM